MNHIDGLRLHNRYFVMRHGESRPNASGILVSHPDSGTHAKHGLTAEGRRQALAAAKACTLDNGTIIVSSDFSRAHQTAEIVRGVLGAEPVRVTPLLRERFYGDIDGKQYEDHKYLWADGADESASAAYNIEPVESVLTRTTQLIAELERAYTGKTILLVSHGDPLRILQTAFHNRPLADRTEYTIANAEIRELTEER